ncbi:Lactose transport system permease protein LacF [Microbacterium hydrocarbonoxydans]|uniref:Lactose transport system permease protein LacF n=1 Tax=Microbacterium hydrocarbonoxydans TaxID=273678 RepID=A0A0M2HSI7_9MICO|nr:sugar ABC transporter permease [Microbacterium hydrocarbonoxydans]KJL47443.1 Lactose transport system permease protein LacF [Microbacterium hydrocarbonoxydans]
MARESVAPRPVKRLGWGQRVSRWDVKVSPYLYVSPFFVVFAIFGAFPLLFNIVVALHDWHRRAGMGDFVGVDNFVWVLQQPMFWRSLENTFSIFLWGGLPQLALALLIAAVLDQNLRARTFWRMSVLIPFVVMPAATSLIFGQLFGQFGVLVPNLHALGLFTESASPFFQERMLSHIAIGSMVVFRWTGYNALILLAAMQAVPREYYEAATVDGAGRLRQFFSVTIPSIRPTLIFVILTMTIGGLEIFDEARLFDGGGTSGGKGGADGQWTTVVLYLYNLGFGDWQDRLGQAAAVGWILALIILAISLLNLLITRSISSSDAPRRGRRRIRPLAPVSTSSTETIVTIHEGARR